LALDLDKAQAWLDCNPITQVEHVQAYLDECQRLRTQESMIPDASVDVVVSNCVLNLVRSSQKRELFAEMYRVLRPSGRCVISDIVSNVDPTPRILSDPALWSGCISGALRHDLFLQMFEDAGFELVEVLTDAAAVS
jgi:SAM-dependent methyltransferase